MKKILFSGLIILAVMLLMPLAVLERPEQVSAWTGGYAEIPDAPLAASDSFRILDTTSGEVTEMPAEEYIFGVVAAEMPALYDTEALKAQAVAAYTFACYRRAENTGKSYDLTTDHTTDQSFTTEEAVREKWGDGADEYCEKIKKAIEETKGCMITFDGKPILAVYHAISSGMTEACEDIWGGKLEYLTPVSSLCDKLSPDYISTVSVTADEFKKALSEECELSGSESDYFGKEERTESGSVKTVEICGTEINGSRIRSLFSLRSSNFEVEYSGGNFVFTVYGYGHGVGMSQYGADYMAKQGSDYKEILTHYYSGCKVEKVF